MKPLGWERPGWGSCGRDVGGDRGQFQVGPRGEYPAHSRVELVLVQPTLHEGDLECLNRLLPVCMRGSHAACLAGPHGG